MDANGRKGGGKAAKGGGETRRDRKSGTGVSGEPKKGGHGGKFTWEGDTRQALEEEAMDSKDPNFDEGEGEEEIQHEAKP